MEEGGLAALARMELLQHAQPMPNVPSPCTPLDANQHVEKFVATHICTPPDAPSKAQGVDDLATGGTQNPDARPSQQQQEPTTQREQRTAGHGPKRRVLSVDETLAVWAVGSFGWVVPSGMLDGISARKEEARKRARTGAPVADGAAGGTSETSSMTRRSMRTTAAPTSQGQLAVSSLGASYEGSMQQPSQGTEKRLQLRSPLPSGPGHIQQQQQQQTQRTKQQQDAQTGHQICKAGGVSHHRLSQEAADPVKRLHHTTAGGVFRRPPRPSTHRQQQQLQQKEASGQTASGQTASGQTAVGVGAHGTGTISKHLLAHAPPAHPHFHPPTPIRLSHPTPSPFLQAAVTATASSSTPLQFQSTVDYSSLLPDDACTRTLPTATARELSLGTSSLLQRRTSSLGSGSTDASMAGSATGTASCVPTAVQCTDHMRTSSVTGGDSNRSDSSSHTLSLNRNSTIAASAQARKPTPSLYAGWRPRAAWPKGLALPKAASASPWPLQIPDSSESSDSEDDGAPGNLEGPGSQAATAVLPPRSRPMPRAESGSTAGGAAGNELAAAAGPDSSSHSRGAGTSEGGYAVQYRGGQGAGGRRAVHAGLAPKSARWAPVRCVVRRSAIAQLGVYVCEALRLGQVVMEYVGEVIRTPVADLRERAYSEDGLGDGTYLFALGLAHAQGGGSGAAGTLVVDATHAGGMARFINHSCSPNCKAQLVQGGLEGNRVFIVALRDIGAGEELTYDYKLSSDILLDPSKHVDLDAVEKEAAQQGVTLTRCLCGTHGCQRLL